LRRPPSNKCPGAEAGKGVFKGKSRCAGWPQYGSAGYNKVPEWISNSLLALQVLSGAVFVSERLLESRASALCWLESIWTFFEARQHPIWHYTIFVKIWSRCT